LNELYYRGWNATPPPLQPCLTAIFPFKGIIAILVSCS
jgi:hypothetical protein